MGGNPKYRYTVRPVEHCADKWKPSSQWAPGWDALTVKHTDDKTAIFWQRTLKKMSIAVEKPSEPRRTTSQPKKRKIFPNPRRRARRVGGKRPRTQRNLKGSNPPASGVLAGDIRKMVGDGTSADTIALA